MKTLSLLSSILTFTVFLSEPAKAQENNSMFGGNNTAFGDDPFNNSNDTEMTENENTQSNENFSLEDNSNLFLENTVESEQETFNSASTQENTANPAPNNSNDSFAETPSVPEEQQNSSLDNFNDPFAEVPTLPQDQQNNSLDNSFSFETPPYTSDSDGLDPLQAIDALPPEQQTPASELAPGIPANPESPATLSNWEEVTAGAPLPESETKENGMTTSEKELILKRIGELRPLDPGNYPEEYIVQPGDTLWDISHQLIGDPFWWPKLWSFNATIMNPHLIEPGMKIIFEPSNGTLPPSLSISDQGNYIPTEVSARTFSPDRNPLADTWKELDGVLISESEIPDFSQIELSNDKTISHKNFVKLPGYISAFEPPREAVVAKFSGQGLAPVQGGVVYSSFSPTFAPNKGERFLTVRPQLPILDAFGETPMGQFWVYSGVLGVVSLESSGRVKFIVEDSMSGVRPGDYIVPYTPLLKPVNTNSSSSPTDTSSNPLTVAAIGDGERFFAGIFDFVHLVGRGGGSSDLREGDLVQVYSHPGGMPAFDEGIDFTTAGLARIVAVSPESTTGVIIKVNQEIVVGSSTQP